jgi:SAM-dependent methyltransferase
MPTQLAAPPFDPLPYTERYRNGEWRAPIFRDMILADMEILGPRQSLTLLDIGCGRGFDDDPGLQSSLAREAGWYVGVEPDPSMPLAGVINQAYRCPFEDAPISPSSVDLAFAVMVLEHLQSPGLFWNKLAMVLRPGGIFWGFTMDRRHWFVKASLLAKRLGIKDLYLTCLHGRRREERYENYPVAYGSNSPRQIEGLARDFRSVTFVNFNQVGQLDYYYPRGLKWLGRTLDRWSFRRGLPGSILAVRAVK